MTDSTSNDDNFYDSVHSDLHESSSKENRNNDGKRKLSLFQLTIMIFTLTCAGPFGIESAIQSGGVLYTLIGLIIIPILYSIPQCLMCSELGCMMPSYHGYIIWVYRAFGDIKYIGNFIGFYNSIGEIISMGSDIPIYTILMSFYFEQFIKTYINSNIFSFTFWTSYLFKLFMIIIGAIFNIFNITTLGNSTILFSFIILLPFIIGFIYSIPNINIEQQWFNSNNNKPYNDNNQYQFGLFFSTLLWLHNGWDSVGGLTAELRFKKSKIFASFIGGIILDYLSYTIPVLAALTVKCNNDNDNDCWNDGYLYTAYNKIIPFLGIFVVISGFISNFSIYIGELAVQARTFWALSQPYVILLENGKMYIQSYNNKYYDDEMNIIQNWNQIQQQIYKENRQKIKKIQIGMFPQLCGMIWKRTGSPIGGVILQSIISAILIFFDFETLLQGTILINGITWALEFFSFIILRYKEPNTYRPFKVSGGLFIAWLITIDKTILIIILIFSIIYESPQYLYALAGNIIFVILWYFLYSCHWNKYNNKNKNNYQQIKDNDYNENNSVVNSYLVSDPLNDFQT